MVVFIEAFEFKRDQCGLNLITNFQKGHGTLSSEGWRENLVRGRKEWGFGDWKNSI